MIFTEKFLLVRILCPMLIIVFFFCAGFSSAIVLIIVYLLGCSQWAARSFYSCFRCWLWSLVLIQVRCDGSISYCTCKMQLWIRCSGVQNLDTFSLILGTQFSVLCLRYVLNCNVGRYCPAVFCWFCVSYLHLRAFFFLVLVNLVFSLTLFLFPKFPPSSFSFFSPAFRFLFFGRSLVGYTYFLVPCVKFRVIFVTFLCGAVSQYNRFYYQVLSSFQFRVGLSLGYCTWGAVLPFLVLGPRASYPAGVGFLCGRGMHYYAFLYKIVCIQRFCPACRVSPFVLPILSVVGLNYFNAVTFHIGIVFFMFICFNLF